MATAQLRSKVMCSICTDVYIDPVTLICGHSFCHDCIRKTLDIQKDGEYFCPECMGKFGRRPDLKKNQQLRNIAEHYRAEELKGDNPEKRCTYCINVPEPAVTLCLHCEAFLCVLHEQTHSKSAEHVLADPTTSLEDRKCPIHRKILEYYCTVDDTCICLHCLTSDHNGHRVSTMGEFMEQKTKNIKPILEKLSLKVGETQAMVQRLQDHKSEVEERASGITERVTAILRGVKRQQEELEKRVLAEISGQKQQILLSISNHIQQLGSKKSELLEKVFQIEVLNKNTVPLFALEAPEVLFEASDDEIDLVKGMGSKKTYDVDDLNEDVILKTLSFELSNIAKGVENDNRVKDIQRSGPLSAVYDNVNIRNRDVANALNIVMGVGGDQRVKDIQKVSLPAGFDNASIEGSKVAIESDGTFAQAPTETTTANPQNLTLISGNKSARPDMLLDVNTASNYLLISDDLKMVSRSDVYLRRPETPEKFQSPQVLSTRGISSGKHELEMEVSKIEPRSGDSIFIGMSYASIDRRGSQALSGDSNDTWGLWVNDIRYSVIQNNEIKWLSNPCSNRNKIKLDYEAGQLSFYELCDPIKHLHTFTATFTQPLHLLISIQGSCWVKILKCIEEGET